MPYNKDTFLKDVLFYTKEKGTFSEMCQRIEGKVYSATNNWEVRSEALEDVSAYRELLEESGKRRGNYYQIYAITPLTWQSIRTDYVYRLLSDQNTTFSMEFIVSFCLACGVNDFDYIKAALDDYCVESLDGKGMRKAMIYGAMRNYWGFDEIAFNTSLNGGKGQIGMMERLYHSFLENDDNEMVINGVYEELGGQKSELLRHMWREGRTTVFLDGAKDCWDKESFLEFLFTSDIETGILYDLVDSVHIVKDCIERRRGNFNGSINKCVRAFSISTNYSHFIHGRQQEPFFFLSLACIFGFSDEETKKVSDSLHVNPNTSPLFDKCVSAVMDMSRFSRHSTEYRQACSNLKNEILHSVPLNENGEPKNRAIKSFCSVLQKIENEGNEE